MPTLAEVAKQPLEQRLGRMSRTADDLAAAIGGQSEAALVRRPDGKNWAQRGHLAPAGHRRGVLRALSHDAVQR